MNVHSRFKTYLVDFVDSLDQIIDYSEKKESFFVVDKKVYELYIDFFNCIPTEKLYLLEAIETKKTIDTALDICEKMTAMPSKRNTHLISVGGGIVQDITGFVANVLYRGIYWTFYPTTLLSACDSCIGGKSSLNYKGFKNLLGTFYPPDNIYIYSKFFMTLSERDYQSGLGEVVKFNVMAGENGISNIEDNLKKLLERDLETVSQFVSTSLTFKKKFIEEDEFDKGVRILLNYAHTFGHAFEVSSEYAIPHGSAVALGMVVANRISVSRGLLEQQFAEKIENICKSILTLELRKEWFDFDIIMTAIRKDKKQTSNTIKVILMKKDLSLEVYDDLSESEIREGIKLLLELI